MNKHHFSTLLISAATIGVTTLAFAGEQIAPKETPPPPPEEDIVVHPITVPYWSDDAFIGTDIRPVFVYHHLPGDILGGGSATVGAVQIRIALTHYLQFVAYKDGYVSVNTPGYNHAGWNNLAGGLKWAFLQNEQQQLHASVGLGYEFASGNRRALQNEDAIRAWLSINKTFFRKLNLGAEINYNAALGNGNAPLGASNIFSWQLHADYDVCKYFSPVFEVNGFHVTETDHGNLVPFSGLDAIEVSGGSQNSVVSAGFGGEIRPCKHFAFRGAYEMALNDNVGLYGHRWTFSGVITF